MDTKSPALTKKPLLAKKKPNVENMFNSNAADEIKTGEYKRVKPKLSDEASMRAQCIPAAIKVKKISLLKKDQNSTICLSSDDESTAKMRSKSKERTSVKKNHSIDHQQSATASKVTKQPDENEPISITSTSVKSFQKKSAQSADVILGSSTYNMVSIMGPKSAENELSQCCSHEKIESPSDRPRTKRSKDYVFVNLNSEIEDQIKKCSSLKQLTEDQIYYMVLRDVNRLIDIFSGCLKSWRHDEYNKNQSDRVLLENSALSNFTQVQFTSAFRGLEAIFCKKNHKYDDYLMSVLLPEVLIGICARVYECSQENAEEFLRITHSKIEMDTSFPKGSLKAPQNLLATSIRPKFRIPKIDASSIKTD